MSAFPRLKLPGSTRVLVLDMGWMSGLELGRGSVEGPPLKALLLFTLMKRRPFLSGRAPVFRMGKGDEGGRSERLGRLAIYHCGCVDGNGGMV